MSQFDSIDPVLWNWSTARGLTWRTSYQDYEVRTLVLDPDSRQNVHVSVDPQEGRRVTVRLGQTLQPPRIGRTLVLTALVSNLHQTLDEALDVAETWLAETSTEA